MKKIMLFFLISLLALSGCSKQKENYPIYEGTVVFKTDDNDKYKFLVLQNISKETLDNGNLQDFIELAQNQEASYYYVNKESYESIEIGQRVKITADFDQLDSSPPIRTVISIEKINVSTGLTTNTGFHAGLAIDLESTKHTLKESDRPALDILEENLIALVQHDYELYRSGFVDDQLADAMDFYYGEQFQYKFSGIESIEKHQSIKNQLHITVLGERLDTTTDSVEQVRMMYAIRQSEQGDWDIYTID